jgi:rRNA maturation RNase YbeY
LFDAELYISLQDTQNNANKYHVPLEQELMRLVVHGVLHLLDYDDKSPKTKPVMKKVENRLVNKYKFILNNNRVFYGN